MAMRIRLARGGSKKRPHYSIVAADSRAARDGRFLEKLGTYDPLLPKSVRCAVASAARESPGADRRGGDLRAAGPPRGPRRPRRRRPGGPGRDRRGRPGGARRARRRPLPRAQEAGRARAWPQDFLHLEYDGGIVYVPVYRIGQVRRYVGRRGRRRPARQAGRQDLAGEAAAGLGRGAQGGRGAAAAVRPARRRCPATPSPRRTSCSRSSRRPSRSRRRPTRPRPSTPCWRTCSRRADGPAGLRRRRLRQDRGGAARHLLAVLGGKQVAVLAPTTVLAEQHFVTFTERLRDFPVRVGVAVPLPQQGGAEEDGGGAGRGQARRGHRHAPAAVARTCASRTWGCW